MKRIDQVHPVKSLSHTLDIVLVPTDASPNGEHSNTISFKALSTQHTDHILNDAEPSCSTPTPTMPTPTVTPKALAPTATPSDLDLLANVVSTRKCFPPSADSKMDTDASLNTSSTMMPNTQQQKCKIIQNIKAKVKAEGVNVICIDNHVAVMSGVLGKLGLHQSFQKPKKPSKAGWKLTPLETSQKVWKFWHDNLTQSTFTSKPARLPLKGRPNIQTSLDFKDCMIQPSKYGISSLVTTWQTTEQSCGTIHVVQCDSSRKPS